MRLHRFIGDFNLSQKEVEISDFKIIKQITTVLRLDKGDKIILSDGKGLEVEAEIKSITASNMYVEIINKLSQKIPIRDVHLYLAILKKENFELAVQKCVEVGVNSITPIITERTIKTGLNTDRLKKIIREASEQCGRSIVPNLYPIIKFEDALKNESEIKIIFDLDGLPYKNNEKVKSVAIFIGPEGGFTKKEIELAKKSEYINISLSPFTLRGETAVIVASYLTANI